MRKLRAGMKIRLISFFLMAACLSVVVLYANQQEEARHLLNNQTKREPVVLTIFGAVMDSTLPSKAFQYDEVIVELERRTGVRIDFTSDLNVSDHSVKLSVMLANKQLPDIVVLQSDADRAKVLNAKAAMPLNELIDMYGPDISRNAGPALEHSRLYRSDDAEQLYFLPGGVDEVQLSPMTSEAGWQIRWDLYRQLGYPKLDTLDDLLDVVERMQQLEPVNRERKKTYGLGLYLSETSGHLGIDRTIASQFGYVQTSWNDAYLDMATGELAPRISDSDSIFWRSMAFYNKAYQRGILDPESATMMKTASMAKHKAGLYMAASSYGMLGGADSMFLSNGDTEKGYAPFLIEHNREHIFAGPSAANGNIHDIFIAHSSPNAEVAVAFLNYLYTYEGMELLLNGIEGKHFERVEGKPIIPETEIIERRENPDYSQQTGIGKYTRLVRFSPPRDELGMPSRYEYIPANMRRLISPVYKQFMMHYNYETVTEAFIRVPIHTYDISLLSSLSAQSGSAIQALQQQLDAYLTANIAKVMFQPTDELFLKEKQKFVEEYRSKGSVEVFMDVQRKYTR